MRFWLGVVLIEMGLAAGIGVGALLAGTPNQRCHAFEAQVDSTAAAPVVHPCNFDTQHLCVTVR